jgi:hypothetical protein
VPGEGVGVRVRVGGRAGRTEARRTELVMVAARLA